VSDTFDNSIQALSEPNRIINALKSSTESIEDMGENTLDALGLKDKKNRREGIAKHKTKIAITNKNVRSLSANCKV
jgi:hypothetical protein